MTPTKKRLNKAQPAPAVGEDFLRVQWLRFIDEYVSNGGNGTKAYLKVYPEVTNENVAGTAAARLLRNVRIRAEINNKLEAQRVTESFIIASLMEVAQSHKNPFASVKALEILARIKGMLTDTKKVEFTGENPAVFLPIVSAENKKIFDAEVAAGKRIHE